MAGLRLAVWLAFLYAVNGQIIRLDTGNGDDGILQSTNISVATPTTFSIITNGPIVNEAGRKICYDSTRLLYTDGNDVRDASNAGTVVFSTPSGENIWGLACCCDVIAITYSTTTEVRIRIIRVNSGIVVDYELDADETARVALKCDVDNKVIIGVSQTWVWIVDLTDQAAGATPYAINPPLTVSSTCVACRKTANVYDIYVSSTGLSTVNVLQVTTIPLNTSVTQFAFTLIGNLDVFCVAIDDGTDDLYLLVDGQFGGWQVRRIRPRPTNPSPTGLASTVVLEDPDNGIRPGFVNGLSVCGTQCQNFNCSVGVDCDCEGVPPCGFCVYNDNTCQCDNSLDVDPCFYTNAVYAAECEMCLPRPDAQMCIFNPLAKRKQGAVYVYGVMSGDGTIGVSRAVRAGRFGPANWPMPFGAMDITGSVTGLTIAGFDAPVPSRLRGSRFGVFWGDFDPVDQLLSVCIPGVVTENSGFTNALYTKTVNLNGNVDLVATMTNPPMDNVRWQFTRTYFDTKAVAGIPMDAKCSSASPRLTCILEGVTRDAEGVYEVYRTKGSRILRVWHPIFYVYVRQCVDANDYGATCSSTCVPACVNGICDDVCGGCVCYPGWMGNDCDTKCDSLDEIGDNCDINCADIFPGSTACAEILVCKPARAGCACRSGLKPPECIDECDDDSWGPNCLKACPSACPTMCDAVDGTC